MEGLEHKENGRENGRDREEIFSKSIRAGKRTYFFDVKATRRNDYYVTITESKKRFNTDGTFQYEKHKLFLYKEDFEKFATGLDEVVSFIKGNQPELEPRSEFETNDSTELSGEETKKFTDIDFDDLKE